MSEAPHSSLIRVLLIALAILSPGTFLLPVAQPRAEAWAEGQAEKKAEEALKRWAALLTEVRSLPAVERKALLLAVRGLVEVDANRLVLPKLSQGGSEALWALKVLIREQAHMSRLAANLGWPEISAYFEKEAVDGARLIRGEIDLRRYRDLAAANAGDLDEIVTPYMADRSFVAFMMEHTEKAQPLAAFIVGESKLFGSGQ